MDISGVFSSIAAKSWFTLPKLDMAKIIQLQLLAPQSLSRATARQFPAVHAFERRMCNEQMKARRQF
jgi:hypothetical protein